MTRKKITPLTEAEVMFKSNMECCVCNKRGDHIHHIDEDNSNSKFDNLALLCFDCHDRATITGSLKKKLSSETIRKYREHKYKVLEAQRSKSLSNFNSPVKGLTTEALLTITKSAIIIIELEKLKEEYFAADSDERFDIINKLFKYSSHTNFRVAVAVYDFLTIIAEQTRGGMTRSTATSVFASVIDFFPASDEAKHNKKVIELSEKCINIGFSIVYDSLIHLNDFPVAMYALLILKYIYKKGKNQKIQPLLNRVISTYDEIEKTLQRPERDDLVYGLELVKLFRNDLETSTLSFPLLPDHLIKRVKLK